MKRLTLTIAAGLLAACAGQAGAAGKIVISKAVEADFQTYKAWVTSIGNGYYAVTEDGIGAKGFGCPSGRCTPGPSAKTKAIQACEQINPGRKCVIFAENQDIVIPYEVAQ